MNPFLASAIMLIIRYLNFIAANQLLSNEPIKRLIEFNALLDDSERFTHQLSHHCLASHEMSDDTSDKKVM